MVIAARPAVTWMFGATVIFAVTSCGATEVSVSTPPPAVAALAAGYPADRDGAGLPPTTPTEAGLAICANFAAWSAGVGRSVTVNVGELIPDLVTIVVQLQGTAYDDQRVTAIPVGPVPRNVVFSNVDAATVQQVELSTRDGRCRVPKTVVVGG